MKEKGKNNNIIMVVVLLIIVALVFYQFGKMTGQTVKETPEENKEVPGEEVPAEEAAGMEETITEQPEESEETTT